MVRDVTSLEVNGRNEQFYETGGYTLSETSGYPVVIPTYPAVPMGGWSREGVMEEGGR